MRVATAVVVLAALGGCHRMKPVPPDPPTASPMERRVRGDLPRLGLAVAQCRKGRTKDGWSAEVDLVDSSGADHDFQYRFDWVAADGRLIATPWSTGHVTANGKTTVVSTAPSADATDYKVMLKE